MSPSFVNDKPHAVRVEDENGVLRRLVPGRVVEADGKYADNLKAAGLSSASEDDQRSWEKHVAEGSGPSSEGATRLASKLLLGPIRVAGRLAAAAPLRRVVGDDAAPYGPPSGTVTTKAEAAKVSDADRRAFADHEALPGEEIPHAGTPNPSLPAAAGVSSEEIHNAQVQNATLAEEVAKEVIEEAESFDVAGQFRSGEPSGSREDAEEDDSAYAGLTVDDLKDELRGRDLPVSGNRDELVARLEEDDSSDDSEE
jgi:hypothetical protein